MLIYTFDPALCLFIHMTQHKDVNALLGSTFFKYYLVYSNKEQKKNYKKKQYCIKLAFYLGDKYYFGTGILILNMIFYFGQELIL